MEVSITKTTKLVKQALIDVPRTRDSDSFLISNVFNEIGKKKGFDFQTMNAEELLKKIEKGVFPNTESIRRTRQLLQEKFPELRGVIYNNRLKEQNRIKEELGYETENNFKETL